MSSGTDHPRNLPAEPGHPGIEPRVEDEAPPVPPRDGLAAWITTLLLLVVIAAVGFVGVRALVQGDWGMALALLGPTAMFASIVPRIWGRKWLDFLNSNAGKDPALEAAESRAMLRTLDRYDRLLAETRDREREQG